MDRTGSVRNGVTALGAAALLLAVGAAAAEPPKTIEPGKLNVALNGDMPMTGLEGRQADRHRRRSDGPDRRHGSVSRSCLT